MGRPRDLLLLVTLQLSVALSSFAQRQPSPQPQPSTQRQSSTQPQSSPQPRPPVLHYTLHIDSSDLSGYTITIHISHAPHRLHLAMATHHEYDDRFRRFVTSFNVQPPASFSHKDNAVWTITTPGDEVQVSYRIQLPPPGPYQFSHRPFLNPNGGLVGDLHSFMYLVEDPHAACLLSLQLSAGWLAATGIDPVSSTSQLLDAPILVGRLHIWHFMVDKIPHQIAWLPATIALPPTVPVNFDTLALVANIQKIVRATYNIFGSFPYHHYTFLLEEDREGALEHGNSVTIGIPANALTSEMPGIYEEIAHEFFHTWNLMHIRPSGYTTLNYGPQQQSPGLWFSEGITMLYADLICRRTGLPVDDSTRIAHLSGLITRYYSDTGNAILPPARVSLASNLQPGPLGDYSASTHLQGELLGTCLDMLIRDATDGRRSFDDVMQTLYRRFSDKQPVRDSDIETAVTTICGCEDAHPFFKNYIYAGQPIDFAPFLRRLGLHLRHDQLPATDAKGLPLPDTRIYSWIRRDDTSLRIGITNPNSCWGLAGLHTGDIITSINDRPTHTRQDFQNALSKLHIGDTAIVTIRQGYGMTLHTVYISSYPGPMIRITQNPAATPRQLRLLRQWLDSK